MTTATAPASNNAFKRLFYRPPFVGLLAFLVVFLMQGLGHTQMVLMESIFGEGFVYQSAFITGLIGAAALVIGMRSDSEVAATWWGFLAGSELWTGWVEFTFVWSANTLGVPDLMDQHAMLPLMLNRETKCNMFRWLQRRLHLSTGKPSRGYERNFGYITCLETVYVLWFCYLALLFIYDENILGDRHPVTYGILFVGTIWSLYLIQRLMQMWKVTTAVRYAIPTAIISYSCYEIVGRWNLFADIWVEPGKYWLELTMFFVALIVTAVIAVLTPAHFKAQLDKERAMQKG
ncbi:MAG: hypothetical protein DYH20_08675 [Gammaproteobacteria bacterium PRO9]|nr:hypothetical protein [Gammaproteobacteria bacterium PRO9]